MRSSSSWLAALVILTEDISRDIGDAALVFERLRFAGVPRSGISDGIDSDLTPVGLDCGGGTGDS